MSKRVSVPITDEQISIIYGISRIVRDIAAGELREYDRDYLKMMSRYGLRVAEYLEREVDKKTTAMFKRKYGYGV